jgi:hypothetical protein
MYLMWKPEDAVTIAAMDTAAVSGGIPPVLEAVVTRFRRCFGGTATTSVSTLTPLEAVPPALPALPPSSPPLAASRVLLVPSVGPALGVMLLALLVALLVALACKTGFLRCFAGSDRVSPRWRAKTRDRVAMDTLIV